MTTSQRAVVWPPIAKATSQRAVVWPPIAKATSQRAVVWPPIAKATKLILIRHGITKWNKEGRYCGYKDVSLSSQGKLDVIKLRKSLNKISFDRIYCSDRKRALQTKDILFGRSGFIRAKGLREINFGVFEGLKHDEIVEKYPEIYKKWLTDPYKGRIPNAEPIQVFKKRVESAIKKILHSNSGKTIAVICHGGVIGIFVSSILESKDFWSYVPASASVTVVEYQNNKFKVNKFNDKKHLKLNNE